MFFSPSAVLAFVFSLFLVGQVAASPLPMPMAAAIEGSVKRQSVPVQDPTKSDGDQVVAYKRQGSAVPVQDASKSDGNAVVAYRKRQGSSIPVQDPVKSDGNAVVAYRRQAPAEQDPSKSDGDAVVAYKRYSNIPLEVAVRSINGVVELY